MTRTQLYAVAALSLTSTTLVLADGGAGGVSDAAVTDALARVVAARHVAAVSAAHAPKAPPAPVPAVAPAPTPAPADSSSASSDSGGDASTAASSANQTATKTPAKHKPAAPKPSKVGHVFVIALSGTGADATFAKGSLAPYLAGQLRPKGTLLDNYVPLGNADLPNYLAFVSGQPPNADTNTECAKYSDFPTSARTGKSGVVAGDGCVYPNTVLSLGDQVTASGHAWRAYEEDMSNDAAGTKTCRHPEDGAADDTLHGRAGDQYATRHNPFVYFHSLLDLGDCLANDVALDQLPTDLKAIRTTPNVSFIAPNLCNDGTESPCADGSAGGPAAVDAFLQQWVPQILHSAAYRHDGLLMITFLSAAPTPPPAPGATTVAPAAPPRTGVLLLSRFAKAGATDDTPYDTYALLRSVEDLFALDPLAKAAGAKSFARGDLAGAFASGR